MKKEILFKVSILITLNLLFISCNDYDSLREDINQLQEDVNTNEDNIELLKSANSINFIENTDNGYKIHFSDSTTIEILNGTNGQDGVDGIDGIDGQDGGDGIDGTDGQNGESAPYIVEIVENETHFIFTFSDNSIIETPINIEFKRIACWGDSLTAQGYPALLQSILGDDEYGVLNNGVGGENSLTIGARQGGIPMYLKNLIEIPATTDTIEIGDKSNSFISLHDNSSPITPLLQGGGFSTINNCIINDIECVIRWTGSRWNDPEGRYTINRVSEGFTRTTTENSIIFTGSMRNHRNYHANIFFVGQNGGYTDDEDLTIQLKKMVDFSSSSNYLVIGLHTGSKSSRQNLEKQMLNEFGARYVNLREYLSTYGLEDAGLIPTEEDLTAMESGICPPQLLSDTVHFTGTGKELLANLIHRRLYSLGIIE